MLMTMMRGISRFLLFVFGTVKVTGRENIPPAGPYIMVINHMSVTDSLLVYVSLPPMRFRFFAGEKWEKHPIFGPLMRWAGAIYINRYTADRKALKEALQAIEAGEVFGLAPEGTRSKVGALIKAREGAAYLASRTNVPILPVGVVNTDRWSHNIKRLRRTHFECYFGRPFMLPDLGRRPKGADLEAYTHYIMVQIAALLPDRYHGFYKDSPALAALLRGEDPWPYCQQVVTDV